MNTQKRYLGLDLAGAKNNKTTLSTIEFFPKENKLFVLDIQSGLGPDDELVETILDHTEGHDELVLAVNAALTLPPCLGCDKKSCAKECSSHETRWMRNYCKLHGILREPTPYTQRAVEIFLRYDVLEKLPEKVRFDIDETMGGNRAPLTARMVYLKKILGDRFQMVEVHPKLSVTLLGLDLKIPLRTLSRYRNLEDGAFAREEILHQLTDRLGVFVYARDQKKIAEHLNCFDAFICAISAWISEHFGNIKPPKNFPKGAGWIMLPHFK